MNLGKLLTLSSTQDPQKTAVIAGNDSISYEQLEDSTTSLAHWFLREGRRPGDRIAIHWSNSIEVVKLFFACFKAGMIAVPVNVRMKAPEIAYVLQHSRAVLCFSQPELAFVATEAGRHSTSLRRIYTDVEALDGGEANDVALPVVNGNDPALILYTSGTTARPKGVTHTHQTLIETVNLVCRVAPDSMQTMLVITPLMHASAINGVLLPAVGVGATAVLVPSFDAALVLDLIERFQCSYAVGLPPHVRAIVEEQTREPREVTSMRTFFAGGDSVSLRLQEDFQTLFGTPLREVFGMTELILPIANSPDAIRPGSLGRVVDGVEARLIDHNGRDVPEGEIGEIALRSSATCVGYWENPQATEEALCDGWLHTGDLGRRDPEGYIWFTGRKKEIIIRGGSNISPQEVEEVICHHPAVREAAVIGLPDPDYGEQVAAFVSLRQGIVVRERELKEHARQRLAEYKIPERIFFLSDLPKGITGKVQRWALKEMPFVAA